MSGEIDLKCMHGRSIYIACVDCREMTALPDDGDYRVICFSPDGICTRNFTVEQTDVGSPVDRA